MHTEYRHGERRLIVRRQPDGVVGINPPQNAPLPSAALAVLALMAGNAVVVRAPRSDRAEHHVHAARAGRRCWSEWARRRAP